MEYVVALIVAIFGSTGFWQWFSTRKATNGEILKAVHNVQNRVDEVTNKVETLAGDIQRNKAITARVRILRFCDDLQNDVRHSKDSFDQCLSDITAYEQYCISHPEFKNNQTITTCKYIETLYKQRLEKHNF